MRTATLPVRSLSGFATVALEVTDAISRKPLRMRAQLLPIKLTSDTRNTRRHVPQGRLFHDTANLTALHFSAARYRAAQYRA
jgi:hypothetical protein